MKILLACPILDISFDWFVNFVSVWEQLRKNRNTQVGFFPQYRKPVQLAQTAEVREAIKGDYDYILHMDDDIWDVPPNAVEVLLGADKDFISAVMYAHAFPHQKCALNKKDKTVSLVDMAKSGKGDMVEADGENVVPVDLTAFPFTLWKTSMFKKIPEPWFVYDEGVPTDNYFCQKCLDNGVQPYVNMSIQVTHRGVNEWNRLYRFVAEGKRMIAQGQIKEDDPLYQSFFDIQKKLEDIKLNKGEQI